MSVLRVLTWCFGFLLVGGGVALLYYPMGLPTWAPYGVMGLGAILLLCAIIFTAAGPAPRSAPLARTVNESVHPSNVDYTAVAHSESLEPDGTLVEDTVRTQRSVRNTSTGRRSYAKKTETVTRRRPARGVGAATRTHKSRSKTVVTKRTR